MKCKTLIIILFVPLVTLAFGQHLRYLAEFVYDGDTIFMNTGELVRVLGIDAPEIGRDGK